MEEIEVTKNLDKSLDKVVDLCDRQFRTISSILEKAPIVLLQIDNFYSSNPKKESDVKFIYNQRTLQNLLKLVELYDKVLNASENNIHTGVEDFKEYHQNKTKKLEYLVGSLRRLQVLLDSGKNIQEELKMQDKNDILESTSEDI